MNINNIIKILTIVAGIFTVIFGSLIFYSVKKEKQASSTQIENNISDCQPVNFKIIQEGTDVYISWNTKMSCTGYLVISSQPEFELADRLKVHSQDGDLPNNGQLVKISQIERSKYPYMSVVSNSEYYGINNSVITLVGYVKD